MGEQVVLDLLVLVDPRALPVPPDPKVGLEPPGEQVVQAQQVLQEPRVPVVALAALDPLVQEVQLAPMAQLVLKEEQAPQGLVVQVVHKVPLAMMACKEGLDLQVLLSTNEKYTPPFHKEM